MGCPVELTIRVLREEASGWRGQIWPLAEFITLAAKAWDEIPDAHRDAAIVTLSAEGNGDYSADAVLEISYARMETQEEADKRDADTQAYWEKQQRERETHERALLAALAAKYRE